MTLDEVRSYLRIDTDVEDNFLNELIDSSQIYIDSCTGEGYKSDEKAAKLASLLQKKLISDLYENRSTTVPDKTKQDKIVTTILDKLSSYEVVL
ncbi:head-tail connector protein [Ruminiclostridium cellulolyticum]|uniref:Uncharacterized phage protein n=1 Tax=Ruminiclostridium cellulolyticum (strain ATCC 35319 / DSM 5812 / JCM 6584 / H10) TaxID=394503 RepID=B8I8R7_RUMCH|nr:head-tail connector protein [Ruminiclostridium cellulolyticum]ACL77249.1 uncharacterized phage protein [Ruminiclostridium cellulolyticum H10]